MKVVKSRELSLELLKAMGCPWENAEGVAIDIGMFDDRVKVVVSYYLNPEWAVIAAKALCEREDSL